MVNDKTSFGRKRAKLKLTQKRKTKIFTLLSDQAFVLEHSGLDYIKFAGRRYFVVYLYSHYPRFQLLSSDVLLNRVSLVVFENKSTRVCFAHHPVVHRQVPEPPIGLYRIGIPPVAVKLSIAEPKQLQKYSAKRTRQTKIRLEAVLAWRSKKDEKTGGGGGRNR